AQASSSTSDLRGQVTDSNGAAIPGATVTLTDAARGTTRTATTDEDGQYTFLAVPPSNYDLKVEAAGGNFAVGTRSIQLTVGQQANIAIELTATGVAANVDVFANEDVVEIEKTQQSSVLGAREILELPVSRRNYLDLALLTPGVSDSDNIADAADFRVAQGRASGLSFGGSNGRGNLVTVDGGPTITTTGGVFETVGQEAVQEFQVLRSSYNAEFGLSSGGIINTVTKSGSNRISGSVFGFIRDDKFDARNAFDFNPDGQSEFNRQQYGGSFGAPIARDRTFFFGSFERFNQNQNTFVNLNNPANYNVSASQNSLFSFLEGRPAGDLITPTITANALGALLRSRFTTTAAVFPRTINLFTSASGQFPFNENQAYFTARVDHNFSSTSNAYVRFTLNDLLAENQAAGALTAVSRGRTLNQFNGGVLLSHTKQFGANTVNEFKADYFYYKSQLTPNDPIGPEFNIEGFGFFGRDIFLPSTGIARHYDFLDNVSRVIGNHTVKFGGNVFFVNQTDTNDTFFGGRFNFASGALPLTSAIVAGGVAAPATVGGLQAFLTANNPALLVTLGATVNALQTFNLNLPIVYQQGFGTNTIRGLNIRTGFYGQDTWKIRRNLTLNYGLRYSINREPFGLHLDKNDFQPRAGFAWDISGDGKTVVRGGAGIFTAYVNRLVSGVIRTLGNPEFPDDNINIVLATATSGGLPLDPANPTGPRAPTSFAVYQRLLAVTNNFTRTATAADLLFFGVVPRENSTLEVRFLGDPNYLTPESYQASLGIERDLGYGFSAEVSYLYNRGIHLTRNRDTNQFKRTGPVNPNNPNGGPSFIRFPTAAQTAAGLTSDFRNPFRFQDNIYESSASSFYHAGTFVLRRRFSQNFSINAHYTYSKTIDEVTDFNSDFSAQNPLDLANDRALSSFDQRHRVVLSGVYQVPTFGDDSPSSKIFSNFVFSPIFNYGSGRPFNLLLGFDANGDGRSQSDRPGDIGRNTGLGESFYSFDARLSRRFRFSEFRNLEILVEGFNLFNRTNLQGINNIVGNLSLADRAALGTTQPRGIQGIAPTAPLGFTSAAPARQLQFGARFSF
ncbi:MAG: carboxypeptidase regulatory-like domain-containing protein, partial [Acidobacteriota bacterium]|nr:carboxypeptidase regulatory-like domain-containing protein [Acidobacteriota bacterium]